MKSIKLINQDRPGLMAEITEIFAQQQINIETLEATSIGPYSIIEMVVDRPTDAMQELLKHGLQAVSAELITIRISDQPGGLARIARELADAKLSIRGISTLRRFDGYCLVALSTDNDAAARKLLQPVLF